MIDRKRLEAWISAPHLEDAAIAGYRKAFASHPARLVVIRDFLVPAVAERLSRFLSSEAEYKPEYGLASVEGGVSEDAWRSAPDEDRFFRLGKLVGTPAQFQASPNALTYLQFRMTFQRPEFRAFFEAVTGMSLGWSDDFGAHAMGDGDFLRPHSDDNLNRQIALVLYLTPGWKAAYGGVLEVQHQDGASTVIHPDFNSLVAFDVLSAPTHLVTPIRAPTGGPTHRLTIGGWYRKAG